MSKVEITDQPAKKKSIFVIVLLMACVLCASSLFTAVRQMQTEGRPLKYTLEWWATQMLSNWRRDLIQRPGDETKLLYRALTALQKPFYLSAMHRLPANDPERIIYWYGYKFQPFMFFEEEKYINQLMPETLAYFELIADNEPTTLWFKEFGQFKYTTELAKYVVHLSKWDKRIEAIRTHDRQFITWSYQAMVFPVIKIYNRLPVAEFYRQHSSASSIGQAPRFLALSGIVDANHYVNSKNMPLCEAPEIMSVIKIFHKKIQQDLPLLLQPESTDNTAFNKNDRRLIKETIKAELEKQSIPDTINKCPITP